MFDFGRALAKRAASGDNLPRALTGKIGKDDALRIADALGIDFDKVKFTVDAFRRGVEVELEHGTRDSKTDVTGNCPIMTGKIAWAHLNEHPDYYKKLDAAGL